MAKVSVEIREKSMRLRFTLNGEPQRPTLKNEDRTPMRPTAPNIKYANRLAAEIQRKMEVGVFDLAEYFPDACEPNGSSLGNMLDTWLATQRLAKSTLAGYASAAKFWKEAQFAEECDDVLGDKVATAVTLTELLTALAMRSKLSGKTVNNYVSVLHEAMTLAVAEGHISKNLAADIPRAKWQKPPVDPFSREEVEAMIAHSTKHYPEQISNMLEAWFFTGMRTGEMFGMRWISVDLASGYAEVSESTVAGEHKDSTKTGVVRNVMLNSRALAAYKRQAKHSRMAGEFVWLDPRYGTPWADERAFRRSYWEPMLKSLGIRYRRPYNARHTYATMLLMMPKTPNPAWCAKQLGHSVEMFLKTYAKWIDGARDREIAGDINSWLDSDAASKEIAS